MSTDKVRIEGQLFWSQGMKVIPTRFNPSNDRYECTIGQLSPKDCEKLTSIGVKTKQKENNPEVMGKYIISKSKFVFKAYDAAGNEVDIDSIGNGTKVVAELTAYKHALSDKHGNAPSIKRLTITELVSYTPSVAAIEDDVL